MEKEFYLELSISPSEELTKRIENIKEEQNIQIYKDCSELFEDLGIWFNFF